MTCAASSLDRRDVLSIAHDRLDDPPELDLSIRKVAAVAGTLGKDLAP